MRGWSDLPDAPGVPGHEMVSHIWSQLHSPSARSQQHSLLRRVDSAPHVVVPAAEGLLSRLKYRSLPESSTSVTGMGSTWLCAAI